MFLVGCSAHNGTRCAGWYEMVLVGWNALNDATQEGKHQRPQIICG